MILKNLQSFIDETDDLLISVDLIGNFLFLNKSALKLFGLSLEESTKVSAFDFIHPDDRESTQQNFSKWVKSKKKEIHFLNRQISTQGEVFIISWKILPHYDDSGQAILINNIGKDVTKLKKNEKELEKATTKLKERVKELDCLYSISKLVEIPNLTIEESLQSIVNIIPTGFQYPDISCARICVDEMVFQTRSFVETKWELSSPIHLNGENIGNLKIFYTKKMPTLDEGPFLKEERDLIDGICERMGKLIERIQINKALKEIKTRYQILTDQFADGIAIIQDEKYKFINKAFSAMVGYTSPKYLIGKKYNQFISKDFIKQYDESILIESDIDEIQDTMEYKLLSRTGKEIWVEEKRNVIDWEFSPALLCTLRDITQKKEQEASSLEETKQLRNENVLLRSSLKERYRFQNIIGISPVMQRVYDQILSAANSDANVSINGESGTGKELVAKAIHDLSKREENTFVTINCGAIPEPLMESEFFGYRKGAFTGAVIDKHGFLDLANNGTLFLDEIGEIPLSMQVKLLRALDDGGYNPIGSNEKCMSNFRIIAATNKDLKKEVVKGNMREDFYYRIQVIPINLPPLRKRKEDIPLLVEHFTQMFSKESQFKKVPDDVVGLIYRYDWAGNIRELQNVLLRYFSTGEFELLSLNDENSRNKNDIRHETIHDEQCNLNLFVQKNEKDQIMKALQTNNWHRTNAAIQLGISRSTLFRRIKKYGLPLKQNARF